MKPEANIHPITALSCSAWDEFILKSVANGEADQRRTTDSALSLDSVRRLIQRLVLAALLCQSPPNPQGISASIYDRNDHQHVFAQRVVDAKGKSLR
jgi:hypothetical protein